VDDEATDAYLRLMELGTADGDWALVVANAERFLAVNPLVPPPWRALARAAGGLGALGNIKLQQRAPRHDGGGIVAEANHELARLMLRRGDREAARRHVLLALEEAPRFRDALRLLRDINAAGGGTQ
jgi:hypothetical protein